MQSPLSPEATYLLYLDGVSPADGFPTKIVAAVGLNWQHAKLEDKALKPAKPINDFEQTLDLHDNIRKIFISQTDIIKASTAGNLESDIIKTAKLLEALEQKQALKYCQILISTDGQTSSTVMQIAVQELVNALGI